MYKMAAEHTVNQFTQGFNGTIFAYGMSGTGKTYSMLGPESVVEVIKKGGEISEEIQSHYGIIPRAIRDIFTYMNTCISESGAQFSFTMNYLEIYKESINDLLQSANNLKFNGNKIQGAKTVNVASPEEIFYNIQQG